MIALASLGPRDTPDLPELVGFGPLAPAQARALCETRPRWLRVVVAEPAEDTTADTGPSPGYAIPDALRRSVLVLHPTCVVPGCHVASSRCDPDHVIPYPEGPTAAWNLRPLCRHHHRHQTRFGYSLTVESRGRGPSGTATLWRTPLGQALRTTVGGITARVA